MKINAANGNAIWARKGGSENNDDENEGYGVAIHDATGDVYFTGFVEGFNVQFDNIPGTLGTQNNSEDVFTAKYDTGGNGLWFRLGGSTNFGEAGWDVDVHQATGDAYVTGDVRGNPNFGLLTFNTQNNSQDVFLAKYNAAGGEVWLSSFASNTFGFDESYAVAVDAAGNAYIAGPMGDEMPLLANPGLANEIQFDFNTFASGTGFEVAGVASYDINGNPRWIRGVGGPDETGGYGVSVSSNGCYLHFVGESDVDPTEFYPGITAPHQAGGGDGDGFIGYLSEGPFGGQIVANDPADTLICQFTDTPRLLNVNIDGNVVQWETSTDCSFGAPTVYAVTDTFFDLPAVFDRFYMYTHGGRQRRLPERNFGSISGAHARAAAGFGYGERQSGLRPRAGGAERHGPSAKHAGKPDDLFLELPAQ